VQSAVVKTVILAGAVKVGLILSLIVIVLETEATVLPQESVAVQVSITVVLQKPASVLEKVETFDIPLIAQLPLNPFVNGKVLGVGKPPQVTTILAGAVIVGKAAGLTIIVLETGVKALPHESVAVQVSVTVPPQIPGIAEKVDGLDVPLIKHPPINPLEKGIVLGAGNEPHGTSVAAGAVIVGKAAGFIVIILETGAKALPHESVAVQVSVTVPPQTPGSAEKVEGLEVPLIRHPPLNPFEKGIVLGAGTPPQSTVLETGAVIIGKAAGLIVIVLVFVIVLP